MQAANNDRKKTQTQLGYLTQNGVDLWMKGVRSLYQTAAVRHGLEGDELWSLAKHHIELQLPDVEEMMLMWFRAVLEGRHDVTVLEAKMLLPQYEGRTPLIDALKAMQQRP